MGTFRSLRSIEVCFDLNHGYHLRLCTTQARLFMLVRKKAATFECSVNKPHTSCQATSIILSGLVSFSRSLTIRQLYATPSLQ